MTTIRVLDEDISRLLTIEADVNAERATMGLDPYTGDDIISGCIQVGLNALTDRNDEPYTATNIPTLSIVGEPYSENNLTLMADIEARATTIATGLGVTLEELGSLALHAGCLVMTGETENKGYRPSFS